MSGGSYDYAYQKVNDFADNLRTDGNPRRMAFQKLLCLVARAMHDIEWVDSCDMGKGDDSKAIDAVLKFAGVDAADSCKVHAFDQIAGLVAGIQKACK